jgi:phytoene dehydrogenase-like protein
VRAQRKQYDVIVAGGGHNGLTAAAYLSRAGLSVLVLERLDRLGGAAVSVEAFAGHPARLSRFSYLVSLLPDRLVAELGLDLRLASRAVSSYTPLVRDGQHTGLLVERTEGDVTRASFRALTDGEDEYAAWRQLSADSAALARAVGPTALQPLRREGEIRELIDPDVWTDFVSRPLGEAIERRFADDTVRGVIATDGVIGSFCSVHDPSLVANRTFLHHVVGNGTGEWRVPVGGMGAVTAELARAAAGAEILTSAPVTSIEAGTDRVDVAFEGGAASARFLLSNLAPWTLAGLRGLDPGVRPQGSQLKINMLLDRLPRLRSGVDPETAFAGTMHVAQGYAQLEAAYADARTGRLPDTMPGEVYCHSLTDPSILGGRAGHTLTYFGIHTPPALFETRSGEAQPVATKAEAVRRAVAAIDEHLVDPLESCLARDANGNACLEAKIPQEIEAELGMPGGHIYHSDVHWPWATDDEPLDNPAARWGVATNIPSVLICGSGARRGGGVSGIGGHNAAHAVLELR